MNKHNKERKEYDKKCNLKYNNSSEFFMQHVIWTREKKQIHLTIKSHKEIRRKLRNAELNRIIVESTGDIKVVMNSCTLEIA